MIIWEVASLRNIHYILAFGYEFISDGMCIKQLRSVVKFHVYFQTQLD